MYKCKSLLYGLALASLFIFPVTGYSDTRSAYGSNDSSSSDMYDDQRNVPMAPNRQMDQQMRMRQQYPQEEENSYDDESDVSGSSYSNPALAHRGWGGGWRGGWGGWRGGYGGYGGYGYRPYYHHYGYRPYYYYSPYYYYPYRPYYYSYGW